MAIDCFDNIMPKLSSSFAARTKGMNEDQQRAEGIKIALEQHKKIHAELQAFRKKAGLQTENYVAPVIKLPTINIPVRENSYKDGEQITFKIDNSGKILQGTYVKREDYPGDMVAVQEGMTIALYELSNGGLLSKSGYTVDEAYDDFKVEMAKKNVSAATLINKLHQKLEDKYNNITQLNPSPAYDKYLQQNASAEEALPYLYNEEERAKLKKLTDEAFKVGATTAESFITSQANLKEGAKREKIPFERFEKAIETNRESNDRAATIKRGDPLKNIKKRETTIEAFYEYLKNGSIAPSGIKKIKDTPDLRDLLYKAYVHSMNDFNNYGYFREQDQELVTLRDLFIRASAGINAKSEKRVEQQPELVRKLTDAVEVYAAKDAEENFTTNAILRAEAKKTYEEVRQVDTPLSAYGFALQYFANGGKVLQSEISDQVITNNKRRGQLNTGARELKTKEEKSRDYLDKNGKTISAIANSIWDNQVPENMQDSISTQEIENEIIAVMGGFNTRLEIAKEFIKSYSEQTGEPTAAEIAEFKRIHEEEIAANEKAMMQYDQDQLALELEAYSSPEFINNIISQYGKETSSQTGSKNNESASGTKETSNQQTGTGENNGPSKKEKTVFERKFRDEKVDQQLKNELDDLIKGGGLFTSGGLDPKRIEAMGNIIAVYAKKGVYKFTDIVEDLYIKYGDKLQTIFTELKVAYNNYAIDKAIPAEQRVNMEIVRNANYANTVQDKVDAFNKNKQNESTTTAGGTSEGATTGNSEGGKGTGRVDENGNAQTSNGTNQGGKVQGMDNKPAEQVSGVSGVVSGTGGASSNSNGNSSGTTVPTQGGVNHIIPASADVEQSFNPRRRMQDNTDAVKVLITLLKENRPATADEQTVLAKYVGFGGLKAILNNPASTWTAADELLRPQIAEFKALIPVLESLGVTNVMGSVKNSTLSAFFTPIAIGRAMYNAVKRLGFNGGRILEPSAGIGNLLGIIPQSMKNKSITAVEKDSLTGFIASKLYPQAQTSVTGYESADVTPDHFDLVISNIPFGDVPVFDKTFKSPLLQKASKKLHTYFFAKALQSVRPGGLVAFITSTGVMDSKDNEFIRKYIAENAEFIGAIRLPSSTFNDNANTSVVSDVIFLRRKFEGEEVTQQHNFINSKQLTVEHKSKGEQKVISVNEYFADNQDNVVGKFMAGGQYSENDMTVIAPKGTDIAAEMNAIIERNFPQNIYTAAKTSNLNAVKRDDVEEGKVFVENNQVKVIKDGTEVILPKNIEVAKAKAYIDLRNVLYELYNAEYSGDKNKMEVLRKELNTNYDAFTKKFGSLNKKENATLLKADNNGYNVKALESFNKQSEVFEKADIFTNRVVNTKIEQTTAANIEDAINISINTSGAVNLAQISSLLGQSETKVLQDNYGTIFLDENGGAVSRSEYLSGNVKEKLAAAKEMAAADSPYATLYEKNVEELEAVIPADIRTIDIEVNLGSRWIPKEVYQDFIRDILRMSGRVDYTKSTDEYKVTNQGGYSVESSTAFGTKRANAIDILETAMKGQSPVVRDSIGDGKTIVNAEQTQLAVEKMAAIKEAFQNWIWTDEGRRDSLGKMYNDKFNTTVKRNYDGSNLSFDGLTGVSLRQHQKDAIAMLLANNGGIIDHIVGAGKTLVMIGAAMEMKRTGIADKPMIIGLKSTIPHLVGDAKKAYPMAKILAPTSKDFSAPNRKAFLAKIANNNYDLIIMTHDQFGMIEQSKEQQTKQMNEEIDALDKDIEALRAEGNQISKKLLQGLEKRKEALSVKIQELLDAKKDSDLLSFEKLGIDHIFVDESQQFKNLQYTTRIRGIAGLSKPDGSKRSFNMLVALRTLQSRLGGDKGATFLSGTPISNSMVEMYLLFKYMRPNLMSKLGYDTFDSWVMQFAEQSNEAEFTVSGGVKNKTRYRKFINVPELSMMYNEITDLRNDDNLQLPKPGKKGGKSQLVAVEQSPYQQEWTKRLIKFGEQRQGSRDGSLIGKGELTDGEQSSAMLMVTTLSAKLSMDMRLIDKNAEDNPTGKLSVAANNVYEEYKKFNEQKGTQLIFSDIGTPKSGNVVEDLRDLMEDEYNISQDDSETIFGDREGKPKQIKDVITKLQDFLDYSPEYINDLISEAKTAAGSFNVYDELRRKLINKGIPAEQIAFIHDYKTEKAKEELFAKVNNGDIRVVLGSTSKLGTGVNIQQRITAIHHLDVLWNPAAVEQRNGRGLRQGNLLAKDENGNEVSILHYGTVLTLDAYKFSLIDTKQRFITQVKTGALEGERSIKDVDGDDNDMATITAMLSGNPLILEKRKIDDTVTKLIKSKKAFEGQAYDAQTRVRNLRSSIEYKQKLITDTEADIKTIEANSVKDADDNLVPIVVIEGQTLTKAKEIGTALNNLKEPLLKKPVGYEKILGTVGGLNIVARVRLEKGSFFGKENVEIDMYIQGQSGNDVMTSSVDDTAQGTGVFRGTKSKLSKIETNKAELIKMKSDIIKLDEISKQTEYPKQAELTEALQKQATIETELNTSLNKADDSAQDENMLNEPNAADYVKAITKAQKKLSEAEKRFSAEQSTQADIFGKAKKEELGLFGIVPTEIKDTLDKLRLEVKKATVAYENFLKSQQKPQELGGLFSKENIVSHATTIEGESVPYQSQQTGDYPAVEEQDKSKDETFIQAVWAKDRNIQFTGTTRVKNHSDVAHIMRLLEDKAVEHAFAVHIDADGNSHIQFISIGGQTGTVVDPRVILAGVSKFGSQKVYLVHNHPTGNLQPSQADLDLSKKIFNGLREMGIDAEHVIMDGVKGEYTVIDNELNNFIQTREKAIEDVNLEVQFLDAQKFLKTPPTQKITSSYAIASYIQSLQYSALPKRAMIILDNQNRIIGNFILSDFSVKEIADLVGKSAIGTNVILYGNEDSIDTINKISPTLKNLSISVTDFVRVAPGKDITTQYVSALDRQILNDVQEKYGTNMLNEPMAKLIDDIADLRAQGMSDQDIKEMYMEFGDNTEAEINSVLNPATSQSSQSNEVYRDTLLDGLAQNRSQQELFDRGFANAEQEKIFNEVMDNFNTAQKALTTYIAGLNNSLTDGKKLSQTAKTLLKYVIRNQDTLNLLNKNFHEYTPQSFEEAEKYAVNLVETLGSNNALVVIESLQDMPVIHKLATYAELAKQFNKEGKFQEEANTLLALRRLGTVSAQGMSGIRLVKKLLGISSADARVAYFDKVIQEINSQLSSEYKGEIEQLTKELEGARTEVAKSLQSNADLTDKLAQALLNVVNNTTPKTKTQGVVDNLRNLSNKIRQQSKGMTFSSIIPISPTIAASAIDLVAFTIEKSGNTLDAIQKGIDYIKSKVNTFQKSQEDKFREYMLKQIYPKMYEVADPAGPKKVTLLSQLKDSEFFIDAKNNIIDEITVNNMNVEDAVNAHLGFLPTSAKKAIVSMISAEVKKSSPAQGSNIIEGREPAAAVAIRKGIPYINAAQQAQIKSLLTQAANRTGFIAAERLERANVIIQNAEAGVWQHIMSTAVYMKVLISYSFGINSLLSNRGAVFTDGLSKVFSGDLTASEALSILTRRDLKQYSRAINYDVLYRGGVGLSQITQLIDDGSGFGRLEEYKLGRSGSLLGPKFLAAVGSRIANAPDSAAATRITVANMFVQAKEIVAENAKMNGITLTKKQISDAADAMVFSKTREEAIAQAEAEFLSEGKTLVGSAMGNQFATQSKLLAAIKTQGLNKDTVDRGGLVFERRVGEIIFEQIELAEKDRWTTAVDNANDKLFKMDIGWDLTLVKSGRYRGINNYTKFISSPIAGTMATIFRSASSTIRVGGELVSDIATNGRTKKAGSSIISGINLMLFGFPKGAANFAEVYMDSHPIYAGAKLALLGLAKITGNKSIEEKKDIARKQAEVVSRAILGTVKIALFKLAVAALQEAGICKDGIKIDVKDETAANSKNGNVVICGKSIPMYLTGGSQFNGLLNTFARLQAKSEIEGWSQQQKTGLDYILAYAVAEGESLIDAGYKGNTQFTESTYNSPLVSLLEKPYGSEEMQQRRTENSIIDLSTTFLTNLVMLPTTGIKQTVTYGKYWFGDANVYSKSTFEDNESGRWQSIGDRVLSGVVYKSAVGDIFAVAGVLNEPSLDYRGRVINDKLTLDQYDKKLAPYDANLSFSRNTFYIQKDNVVRTVHSNEEYYKYFKACSTEMNTWVIDNVDKFDKQYDTYKDKKNTAHLSKKQYIQNIVNEARKKITKDVRVNIFDSEK